MSVVFRKWIMLQRGGRVTSSSVKGNSSIKKLKQVCNSKTTCRMTVIHLLCWPQFSSPVWLKACMETRFISMTVELSTILLCIFIQLLIGLTRLSWSWSCVYLRDEIFKPQKWSIADARQPLQKIFMILAFFMLFSKLSHSASSTLVFFTDLEFYNVHYSYVLIASDF